MPDVRLTHPLKSVGLDEMHYPLEACAHVTGQCAKCCFNVAVEK
jgi:hypothetical protein